MARAFLVVAAAALVASGCGAHRAAGGGTASLCAGSQLAGGLAVIRGSAGAGNIVYRLTLRNRSSSTCAVTGVPKVQLLGRTGKPLPTHGRPARPGAAAAVLVILAPNQTATATARFSPDVPGVGEPTTGRQCEPTAYRLRVAARGGGTTIVAIRPPTPVCEHGQLQLSNYGRL